MGAGCTHQLSFPPSPLLPAHGWDGRRSDLSAETPGSVCVLQTSLYLRCSVTTVTVRTKADGLQEHPGSLLLAGERDGGDRTCPGAATKDGDGTLNPKTLLIWWQPAPLPAPRGCFGWNCWAWLNLLSFWAHPLHLTPPPKSVPSSSHPLPPPRAFPSCYLTAVLKIMIIKICR